MKIIHAADLHIGSKLTSKLNTEEASKRRAELNTSFENMVKFASDNDVSTILLSGDVFDSDNVSKRDKLFFYNVINNNKDINFYYLKGNHDLYNLEKDIPSNLYLFNSNWEYYNLDFINIAGIELDETNKDSLYDTLKLDKNKFNIVMLHGDIFTKVNYIDLLRLKNKNIDYLALGHIHERSEGKVDDRGIYVYPGCLEGRDFGELNDKGFYLLDISENNFSHEFIKNSKRVFHEISVDLTNTNSYTEGLDLVKEKIKDIANKDAIRIILEGYINYDVADLISYLNTYIDKYYIKEVKNKTLREYNISDYVGDKTLKGEFVRLVLSDTSLNEEEKGEIITLGLKALKGDDI